MTRRRLRPDEIDLWRRVAAQTTRLHPESRQPDPVPKPRPKPAKPAKPRLPEFRIGQRAPGTDGKDDILPSLSERIAQQPLQMDAKSFARLRRGKLKPEARLDLHGMTLAEAHPALIGFVLRAQAENKRLVLVITGKGKPKDSGGPVPMRRGVLRHQVPQWLATPPLAQAVLQVSEAHLRHGGGGAFYVYLRRGR